MESWESASTSEKDRVGVAWKDAPKICNLAFLQYHACSRARTLNNKKYNEDEGASPARIGSYIESIDQIHLCCLILLKWLISSFICLPSCLSLSQNGPHFYVMSLTESLTLLLLMCTMIFDTCLRKSRALALSLDKTPRYPLAVASRSSGNQWEQSCHPLLQE